MSSVLTANAEWRAAAPNEVATFPVQILLTAKRKADLNAKLKAPGKPELP